MFGNVVYGTREYGDKSEHQSEFEVTSNQYGQFGQIYASFKSQLVRKKDQRFVSLGSWIRLSL